MLSLIIVEDELFMADFLENFINWKSCEVEVIGVYHDGASAFEAICEKKPDMVLTDINMPVMNGLEMIEKVLEKNIKVKFIIISGYNDFYLVKKAFKLGATDYFLKTELDPSELENLVNKMKYSEGMHVFATGIDRKETILKEIIRGLRNVEEYEENLNIFKYKTILSVGAVNYDDVKNKLYRGDKELLKYGMMKIVDEIMINVPFAECCFTDYDKLVFIVSDNESEKNKNNVCVLAEIIRESLFQSLSLVTSAGYCGTTESIKELEALYDKARIAEKFSFVQGYENVYDYNELVKEHKKIHQNVQKMIIEFENLIFDFDFETLSRDIEKFLIKDISMNELDCLVEIYRSYFIVLSHFSNKHDDFKFEMIRFERIIKCGTLKDMNSYFIETINELVKVFKNSSNTMTKVQKYINENYDKDISLQTVADEFKIDYKKLSRIFIQKTGENFKKYLTNIRMKEALRLIKETDFLLYEISEMVGYNNYANFSRSFMKYYNKWPKDIERG